MLIDDETLRDPYSAFIYGAGELRRAQMARDLAERVQCALRAANAGWPEIADEKPGFDPYNSSGRGGLPLAWARLDRS